MIFKHIKDFKTVRNRPQQNSMTFRSSPVRRLCWFATSASAAIFLAVYLLPEDQLLTVGIFCAFSILLSPLFRENIRRAALAAAGLSFGFLYVAAFGTLFRVPAERLIFGEPQTLSFTVVDFPWETSMGAGLEIILPLEGTPNPKAILYAEASALDLRPGDEAVAEMTLRSSGIYRGESSDYYPAQGVYLIGYAKEVSLLHRPDRVSLFFRPILAGQAVKDAIASLFPSDVSGFVTALVTGDKRSLPTGLYAAFRRSGLAHAVAVSGLHVGFLAGRLTTLLGKRSRLSAVLGILLVFFFAAMVGNGPSVTRAAFMQAFLLLALLVRREADQPTTLAAVLMLVLLPCPYAAASVSLQLSFAAVAGIYLITGPLYSRWLQKLPKKKAGKRNVFRKLSRQAISFLLGTLATTFGALLFTMPLSALYFQSVSLAGPFTNLLTLWAVSEAFQGGLIAALTGMFSPGFGRAVAWLSSWPARWVCFAARAVAKLPFAAVSLSTIYLSGWFLLTCLILFVWVCFRKSVRPLFPVSICTATLCAALVMSTWNTFTGTLVVSVLNVGQGESVLFFSKGYTVLVDCGGNLAEDPGDIAADAIQSLGTSRLDALILTHCHTDHAGGVPELLSRLEVKRLILPDTDQKEPLRQEILSLAEKTDCEIDILSQDARLPFGNAQMELYAPLGDGGANEEGLSVLCSAGTFRVLLTGDMNAVVERRLVAQKNLPDIDLLIAGHHGSKYSSSEELLTAVTPELAVISSGWNSYGHPAPETLARLGSAGCGVYLTRDQGTVTFTCKGERTP